MVTGMTLCRLLGLVALVHYGASSLHPLPPQQPVSNVTDNDIETATEKVSTLALAHEVYIVNTSMTIDDLMESLMSTKTPEIYEITLDHCRVTEVPPYAFSGLTTLLYVELTGNNIARIPSYAFDGQEDLNVIRLQENNISFIQTRAFNNLTSLYKLVLSGNNIMTIDGMAFTSTPLLDEIYLSGNKLAQIPFDALKDVAQLRSLFMADNLVTEVSSRITELGMLKYLDLRRNKLISISGSLRYLDLKELWISGNQLNTLPDLLTLFNRPGGLNVSLSGNPWNCDCRLRWLIQWVQEEQMKGSYPAPLCQGQNNISMDSISIQTLPCTDRKPERFPVHVLAVAGALAAVVGLVAVGILTFIRRRKSKLTTMAKFHQLEFVMNGQYYRARDRGTSDIQPPPARQIVEAQIELSPRRRSSGCPRKVFGKLRLGELIGRGAFGHVFEGKASGIADGWTTVAVKKLNDSPAGDAMGVMQEEFNQMMCIGKHANVVELYGSGVINGKLIIVMEFASLGDLLSYLRKLSQRDFSELVLFAWHIAKGMRHLARLKVVHRDLAARNILLFHGPAAKISDFGLSRDVYESGYYCQDSKGRLPYKWLSPEALLSGKYSLSSDVWSFGILLWELVTLGSAPYPGVPPDELAVLYKAGYKMPQPVQCPDNIYDIMKRCWSHNEEERPTFDLLVDDIDKVLEQTSSKTYVEIT